jgi:hypothetical protein
MTGLLNEHFAFMLISIFMVQYDLCDPSIRAVKAYLLHVKEYDA